LRRGRAPSGTDVGAKLDALDPNWNHLEIVGTWDERIVMVAGDADFADWQREWLAENTTSSDHRVGRLRRRRRWFGRCASASSRLFR
jgi:hypothetical protein